MRLVLPSLSLVAFALAGCAVQSPQDQLAPMSSTVRLCEGNNCSELPRNTATFRGEPVNPEAERRRMALEQKAESDPRAAYDLGLRYLRGDGVERNTYQAIEWMRKAGDAGNGNAQFALGRLYLLGFEEMGSDPAEAEAWLSRASAKGFKEAKRLLPQAQAAKQNAHARYQAIEDERKSWNNWYVSGPYYMTWSSSGWYWR